MNILIIEDLPTDAELEEREVRQVLPESRFLRVETREGFLEALTSFRPDVILSDYKLPGFDGMSALKLALVHAPETPFIIVTGSMNEETAVNCMKAGAWDYIIKEHVRRLGPAVLIGLEQRRLRREQKLAEAERALLMMAVEQVGEIVIITDPAGIIQYVNPAFEKVTGYSRDEAMGRTPRILKSGLQNEAFYREFWETITGGKTWTGRLINKRRDGLLYTAEMTVSPVFDASGRIVNFVAVKRDITEHLRMADELHQSQKMESVGRLAGGVAHDFNNMLNVIIGYAELAMEKAAPEDELQADLAEIASAGRRSAEITRQLLAFARKQAISPEVIDLNETVESMLKMLRRLIGENIDLAWLPGSGLWQVLMDISQVDQILANLCANARDAVPDVGKVTIETGNVTLDDAYCKNHAEFVPGDFVLLAVSDTGCGMDSKIREKIFEPFFTTKELGKGTGLGLATVYGIVRQNNGFIHVYSEPGQGTAFKIYLPRHQGVMAETPEISAPGIPAGHGETILIVEDEAVVLGLARKILESTGYTVLTAETPDAAIRLAENHASPIHLLITDVILPGMNGRDLAARLQAIIPSMKCLFMSGYTADAIAHHGVLEKGIHFLQKPFSVSMLAVKVREVLHEPRKGGGP